MFYIMALKSEIEGRVHDLTPFDVLKFFSIVNEVPLEDFMESRNGMEYDCGQIEATEGILLPATRVYIKKGRDIPLAVKQDMSKYLQFWQYIS